MTKWIKGVLQRIVDIRVLIVRIVFRRINNLIAPKRLHQKKEDNGQKGPWDRTVFVSVEDGSF